MPDDDPTAQLRGLPWRARMLSTGHPHAFYWAAAATAVGFAVLGGVLMYKSVVGGVLVIAIAIMCAAFVAWPGHWSEQHPTQAAEAVELQRRIRTRMAQRHPAYFLVVVPLITALVAASRWNRDRHQTSAIDWLVPAALGLAFGFAVGIVLVVKARRSRRET